MSDTIKRQVLGHIASARAHDVTGRATVRIGKMTVHTRFCSQDARGSAKYKFNISPTTLAADYELWICGSAERYYLIPHATVESIYHTPGAYVDRRHPQLRVISVDVDSHVATYAQGGESLSLRTYSNRSLP